MSEPNPFFKSVRQSPGIRIAILFGAFFIFLLGVSIVTTLINSSSYGDERTHILWGSVAQCVLAFCFPAFLLARFCSNNWANWLELKTLPSLKALLGVCIVYVISLPTMEWLIQWNANIHFPESLSALETLFRSWEESSEVITKTILNAHGWIAILEGVLVVGLLTGFSEEVFFRGGLQKILTDSNINSNLAVWCGAIIFSAMHFQFFGFFPRLLMGVFFGYLLIWTRSIWVPVFAHALNNSVVVITGALTAETSGNLLDTSGSTEYLGNPLAVAGSILITSLFLIVCRNSFFKSDNTHNLTWQKSQQPPVSEN